MDAARQKLLKRIETEGYKPLAKTLEKYGIQAEAKAAPKKRTRDPETMKKYSSECYLRHREDYIRKNLLYKIANGHRPLERTLVKHGLPTDLLKHGPFHPMVLNRKSRDITGDGFGRPVE